jgi:secreted trypsin-like serine protease
MDIKTSHILAGSLVSLGIAAMALTAPASAQQRQQLLSSPTTPYNSAATRVKGKAADKGVYHGETTPKGAFPFMVALIQSEATDDEEGNYQGQFCGGALISDHWVVTASHCVTADDADKRPVQVPADKIDIYAGSNDFKGGKRIKVKRIIRHPQYNPDQFDNDIALLELAASARSPQTGTIALVTPQTELRHVEMDIMDRATCNTSLTNYRKTGALVALLRKAQVNFGLSDGVVQQVRTTVESNIGKIVTENMICSGRERTQRDTCQGDSGGPLFAKGTDGKFTLVGVTSWGELCGISEKGLYGIYARVARFSGWVQQTAK